LVIVEISFSIVTLLSAYSVVFQYLPRAGVLLGFFMQFAWCYYWWTTGQVGIILLDAGILGIYIGRLIKYFREYKEQP
jgi:hypothetical protein